MNKTWYLAILVVFFALVSCVLAISFLLHMKADEDRESLDFAFHMDRLALGDSLLVSDVAYPSLFSSLDHQLDKKIHLRHPSQFVLGAKTYVCTNLVQKGQFLHEILLEDPLHTRPFHYRLILDEGYLSETSVEIPIRTLLVYWVD